MKKQTGRKTENDQQPRASVTFPRELYESLEQLAKEKRVSIAWVVREAAEKYVAQQQRPV